MESLHLDSGGLCFTAVCAVVLRVVSLAGLLRVLKCQISHDLPVWVLACFHGCCLYSHTHPHIPSHLFLGSGPTFSGCLGRVQDLDSSPASLSRGWPPPPCLLPSVLSAVEEIGQSYHHRNGNQDPDDNASNDSRRQRGRLGTSAERERLSLASSSPYPQLHSRVPGFIFTKFEYIVFQPLGPSDR